MQFGFDYNSGAEFVIVILVLFSFLMAIGLVLTIIEKWDDFKR
jgi:hypothetical protein